MSQENQHYSYHFLCFVGDQGAWVERRSAAAADGSKWLIWTHGLSIIRRLQAIEGSGAVGTVPGFWELKKKKALLVIECREFS